jgi:uncharacterized protein involved in exopolysaccharide biosynthesis
MSAYPEYPEREGVAVSVMKPHAYQLAPMPTVSYVRQALKRRVRVLGIAFAALSAGAVAAVLTAPPIYEGAFKLLVKHDRADAVVTGVPGSETARPEELSESELLSQVELLKAQDLREKVAVDAGLTTQLLAKGDARTEEEALALALKTLDRNLAVTPIKKTWLINVTYRDKDPQVTRKVLDLMVQNYFQKHLALQRPSGTFEFFSEQVDRAHQELQAAQQALLDFSREAGVVSADAEQQAALQKLSEFDAMRLQAAAALAEANHRQTAASAELARVPETRVAQTRVTQNPGAVQDIQSRVLQLEMRRTELLQRYTPEYRGLVETEQQLRDARTALATALQTNIHEEIVGGNPTHDWLDTEVARARTENAAIAARLQALSGATAQYRSQAQQLSVRRAQQADLARNLAAAEDRYRLYLSKREEARISDELDKTRITNVAIAQAPALNHIPKRRPSLAMLPLLIVVAFFLSAALALVLDAVSSAPGTAPRLRVEADDDFAAACRPFAAMPPPAAAQFGAAAEFTRANTARLSTRLAELQALTESVATQWEVGDRPARVAEQPKTTGWMPIPNADGLRQGA